MWQGIGLIIVAVFLARSCVGVSEPPPKPAAGFTELDAMQLCRQTISNWSRDPAKAEIPMGRRFHSDLVFHFAWTPSDGLRLRNGLGLDMPVTAACTVDRVGRRITLLNVDGQTLIAN